MKRTVIVLVVVVVAVATFFVLRGKNDTVTPTPTPLPEPTPLPPSLPVSVVAENLSIPWDIAFLPDGSMLVTERTGKLLHIEKNGARVSIPIDEVHTRGEGGLLGLVLHPKFSENHWLYLYLSTPGKDNNTENKVMRYTFADDTLSEETQIIGNIPGAIYHDGGRMDFGPDGLLYITTGDATTPAIAQDIKSLGGKILRVRDDGTVPENNPFETRVYSYGHRNPQGLAWDSAGHLWETEHGRSGALSGLDEINLIEVGKNYGWPEIEGDKTKAGMEAPKLHSGADATWAPASLVYHNGKLFFGGLRGEALYEVTIAGDTVTNLKAHYKNEWGRIRTIRKGPDGMFYITTSNKDGRGVPHEGDDKIIRIDPSSLK